MALEWFKVDVNFTSHPKLVHLAALAPDATGIIIRMWSWTARYAPTGCVTRNALHALQAEMARGIFDTENEPFSAAEIYGSAVKSGWLDEDCNGGVTVHGWEEEQPDHVDAKEKKREQTRVRVAAHRARNASVTLPVTQPCNAVTLPDEKRVDEKRRDLKEDHAAEEASAGVAPVGPTVAELSADWPPDKLALAYAAIASTRASGKISDGPWRAFLLSAAQFARPIRLAALDEYLDRACAAEKKGERYLLGIMRGENSRPRQQVMGTGPPRSRPGAHVAVQPEQPGIPGRKYLTGGST